METAPPREDPGPTLGAQVTARILDMIASGELKAGQRLIEPAIARRLGVGTVPVREALRILAGDGVVDIVPHKGATLRRLSPKEIADTLKGIVGLLQVAIGDIDDAALDRLLPKLETASARIGAAQTKGNCAAVLAAAAEFQLHFIRAGGNAFVERSIRKTHFAHFNLQLLHFVDAGLLGPVSTNYPAIVDAARRHDRQAIAALFAKNARMVCVALVPESC